MMTKKVSVTLYTVPSQACCLGKMDWSQAGQMLQHQLRSRLGDQAQFSHIEFMTAQWYEDAHAQKMMEKEDLQLPFVLVNGELASTGDKIHISRVIKQAASLL
jgi:hypothetical protein